MLGPLPEDLLAALGGTADPDLALLQLARLSSAVAGDEASCTLLRDVLSGVVQPEAVDDARQAGPVDPVDEGGTATVAGLAPADEGAEAPSGPARSARDRLLAVLGASVALGDDLVSHPGLLHVVADPTPGTGVPAETVRAELLRAVDADPDAGQPVAALPVAVATDAMRRAYRARILRIAATDLTAADPLTTMPAVAAALADLAAAALEAALAVARAELDDHGEGVRLAVMGMGKCGGRELNYVCDVDVIYVAEPADGYDEAYAHERGCAARDRARQGRARARPRSRALWPVDAALRPEGKNGPLVRTPREPSRVLRALGQDLGVPGAAQGPAGRGGRRSGSGLPRRDQPVRVDGRGAGELRRGLPGHAAPGRGPRTGRGGGPSAQARQGGTAGRRVHRPAPAARARAGGRLDPQPQHPHGPRGAGRGRIRRP